MILTEKSHTDSQFIPQQVKAWYCQKAYQAMLVEVNLSPKPGLVDRFNCGAHKDMVLDDFYRSARAIHPFLMLFMEQGAACAHLDESHTLSLLRPIGIRCENAMLRVTSGVNTHKGTIFSLGLLFAALGRLYYLHRPILPDTLCKTVAAFCCGLTDRELRTGNKMETAGKRLYQQHGLKGARGEAEAGFPLVVELALPHYQAYLASGREPESALLCTLLVLIANNDDTNIAARGSMSGLKWIRQKAKHLLDVIEPEAVLPISLLDDFNQQCIERNLSPGGSADLLIITWFLAEILSFNQCITSPHFAKSPGFISLVT